MNKEFVLKDMIN